MLCDVWSMLIVFIRLFDAQVLDSEFIAIGQLRGSLHRDSKWVIFYRAYILDEHFVD